MSQENAGPGQGISPSQDGAPSQDVTPRRKLGCFWKGLLIAGGALVLIVLLILWQVLSVKSWIEDGMESTPVVLPAPQLSQEEQQGIDDLYGTYPEHYEQKQDIDVLLTPAQFNKMIAENITKEKAKGNKTDLESLQVSFDGPQTVLRGSAPVPDREGLYYNFEVRGDFAIENAKATSRVDSVFLRGQDAPFSAKTVMQEALKRGFADQEKRFAQGQDSIFSRLRLLRREGDRIHVIMNGQHLQPPGQ